MKKEGNENEGIKTEFNSMCYTKFSIIIRLSQWFYTHTHMPVDDLDSRIYQQIRGPKFIVKTIVLYLF
jgi:hypothetical protein